MQLPTCPSYNISVRSVQKTPFLIVVVQLLPWERVYLRSHYSVTAIAYLFILRSLSSKGSTYYNTLDVTVFLTLQCVTSSSGSNAGTSQYHSSVFVCSTNQDVLFELYHRPTCKWKWIAKAKVWAWEEGNRRKNYVILGVSGKLMLGFTSTVFLGSRPCGTHYHIFLSHDTDLWLVT